MKRRIIQIIYIYIAISSFFSLTPAVFATGINTYALNELGMTVLLPSDFIVFTRALKLNDPNLDTYSLTKDEMLELMLSRNIYLNAWDEDINFEIIITMIDSPLVDFNLYSDTVLSTIATSFKSEYEKVGIKYVKSEIYKHEQAKFLKIYISQKNEDKTVYGLQYYTVYDDKAINITMQSYSGDITSSNEATLKTIIDSATFETEPQIADPFATPTSAFTYTDTKTQTSFTVPANWIEVPLSKPRDFIDVKFMSNKEYGMVIMYGAYDLWDAMTASERTGYSRADIDNTILTKSEIAEMGGFYGGEISLVNYNGIEYYKTTGKGTNKSYGFDLTGTMTGIFLIENGYMHLFQFSGSSDNEYYDDFESLLQSVKYQHNRAVSKPRNSVKNSNTDISNEFSLPNLFIDLIFTIFIYSLPIMIYRYAIKKEPVDSHKAKWITIIYGIVSFIVMSILKYMLVEKIAGYAIWFWSYVNYRMLIGGTKKYVSVEPSNENESSTEKTYDCDLYKYPVLGGGDEDIDDDVRHTSGDKGIMSGDSIEIMFQDGSDINFCHKCGNKLQPDSEFCNKCGTKIPNVRSAKSETVEDKNNCEVSSGRCLMCGIQSFHLVENICDYCRNKYNL